MATHESTAEAVVFINLILSSSVYRRADDSANYPILTVTTMLQSPEVAAVKLRGERGSGTILEDGFWLEHFEFYDLTDSRAVNATPFPGTRDPRMHLEPRHIVELKKGQALVTDMQLEDMEPLADPVRMLQAGHEYKITLRPQDV